MWITKDEGSQYWKLWEYKPVKEGDLWQRGGSSMLIGYDTVKTAIPGYSGIWPKEVELRLKDK